MISSDLYYFIIWWGMFFIIGIINLPLTFLLFRNFQDKGYIFSKILGILLISYFVWLLGSLRILPFTQVTVFLSTFLLLAVNVALILKKKFNFQINGVGKIIIAEEIGFFTLFVFWAYVRGTNPEIRGLEKFMDYGFVNSILRGNFFPPKDIWLTPFTINYYYFGHAVTAILTKLINIDSSITYNLMLATLFAFTFTGTFSLSMNLFHYFYKSNENNNDKTGVKLSIFSGFISGFLCSLGGNLHTIIYLIKNGADKYWYPDATRYIPYTIHEFPIYSFVVSDLHGHVLDIPFVLLILSLVFVFLTTQRKIVLPFLGFVLGVSYMTNAWDLPIYLLVSGSVILYFNCKKHGPTYQTIKTTVVLLLILILVSVITSLPFQLNFSQIAKGISFVEARSPLYQLLVLWGFPFFMVFSFIIFLFHRKIASLFSGESIVRSLALILGVKVQIIKDGVIKKIASLNFADTFVLIMALISVLLIIFPEIFYIKDIYIKEYHRANTMFKFVYQSFLMFSIMAGYIATRIISSSLLKNNFKLIKKIWLFVFALGFTFLAIYPYFAIRSYYNGLKFYQGIDGIHYLKTQYPSDFEAIIWMKKNIFGQPVILEAVGESYTDYSRISAFTGIPTVLGWPVHEWLWRGSYDEAGKRTTEVARMYESRDINEVKSLLKKHNVSYVVLGSLEKQKYKNIYEDNFLKLGKVIFQKQETKIYKISI